jgi:gentisate 1,2-dioxygenase
MVLAKTLADLEREMAARSLGGHWQIEDRMPSGTPQTTVRPHLWRWDDVYDTLMQAGELVSMEFAGRRTIRLFNPGIVGRPSTTHTLHMSVQLVKPGEVAECHRHTMAALRFVVQGNGAYTTVEGVQCRMAPGDLILTPQWTWHDHTNDGTEPMVWLDGLDIPLVQALQQVAFEPFREERQPVTCDSDAVGSLHSLLGSGAAAAGPANPYYHYRWADAAAALATLARTTEPDPYDAYRLDYRNPANAGPTLPTIGCALTLLPPGQETRAHRHTSTVIYHAFRGRGTTYVGDERLDWGPGDTFVVPLWHAHRHAGGAGEEAVLFSMSDAPVIRALGLYREERE